MCVRLLLAWPRLAYTHACSDVCEITIGRILPFMIINIHSREFEQAYHPREESAATPSSPSISSNSRKSVARKAKGRAERKKASSDLEIPVDAWKDYAEVKFSQSTVRILGLPCFLGSVFVLK